MERDWYTRAMLVLATAYDQTDESYLSRVDSVLDDITISLGRFQRDGVLSGLSTRRALNLLTELRSRLERARNAQDVRQAFLDCDRLRDLVDEAREASRD